MDSRAQFEAWFRPKKMAMQIRGISTVRMVPPHKTLIVSVVLSVFAVGVGSAIMLAWPVILLLLRINK